ncbi:MAG: pyruvate, phosphate dikinase [Actinomycetota bacterium]|nr:pyruvate, phosphate dikinase [Actinomycetota bacterium]
MRWIREFSEGSRDDRELLGGKGAGVAEMTRVLGASRVPAGFTITTEACVAYMEASGELPEGLAGEIDEALAGLEVEIGMKLGDPRDPLLVSVRSGARVSMPGMLDTVLNLGLNDESVEGLAERTGSERFARDSYRRFIQMFGNVVRGIPGSSFEEIIAETKKKAGAEADTDLGADELAELISAFKGIYIDARDEPFPQDPRDQLAQAISAVFDSWEGERAIAYRRINGIPDDWGTAVNVQRMVFGNRGDTSGSGVAFSRDERTGEAEPSGDFLANAQGEDVVAGTRDPQDLEWLAERLPEAHGQLMEVLRKLEGHYKDMQDVEFTIEDGELFLLQTRTAKRPAQAAVRFAVDAASEGLLSRDEALMTIDADTLENLLHPIFDPDASFEVLTQGIGASPGAAVGAIVLSAQEAVRRAANGEDVILVRPFTEADDISGFHAAKGILTAQGGKASHAALVARGMGRPCVAGASAVKIDAEAGVVRIGEVELHAGDTIAIEGATGQVTAEDVPLIQPEIGDDFAEVLGWADDARRLGVRANGDTAADAKRARELGAEGIGLCRTEHMFFGEDRADLVRGMFVSAARWRKAEVSAAADDAPAPPELEEARAEFHDALTELGELQRGDFVEILHEMRGLPVTVRLLDPPLHEFLPLEHFEAEVRRLEAASGDRATSAREAADIVRDLQEANPMLGTRGVRLAFLYPQIYEMQVRAAIRAAADAAEAGDLPHIEIMIPLVAYETELRQLREHVVSVAEEARKSAGSEVPYSVGTMIELPRACLIAGHIARHADFFSFGTNDLTQTTIGLSRDDVEGSFMPSYLAGRIIDRSPFEVLDGPGVGELVRIGAERGRAANPDLKLGICGEHGGDPESIRFFDSIGLDYVSCSPYRTPVARLAAAQAAIDDSSR